jgi:hypothetical protein
MSSNNWGPLTWLLLHTLTIKLKDEYYDTEKEALFNLIKNICNNLPCPYCRHHARKVVNNVNIKNLKTKKDLMMFIFNFHNEVNSRLKKPLFKVENLESKYNLAITNKVYKAFIKIFTLNSNNQRLLTDNFHRRKLIHNFIEYYNNNKHKYNE